MSAITTLANTSDTKYAEVVNDSDAAATGINPENLKTLIHNIFIKVDEALAKTNTHTNDIKTTEEIQDIVGAMFTSNTETRIAATYVDGAEGAGKINLVVDDLDTDSNTTYAISVENGDNTDEEKIRITASTGGTDDIVLEAGTGLTIARDGDKITFTNTVTDTTYTVGDGGLTQNNFTNTLKSKLDGISGTNTGDNATNSQYSGLVSNVSTALSVGTNNTTELSITSDGGTDDVTLPVATTSLTGVMNSAMFDTLAAATSNTGTVTSVAGAGTVNGLTLTGTVSTSGNLTLGGTLAINNGDWSGTALADGNIASASTWNSKQSQLTFGLNDTNSIVIDGGAANNQFAHFTASGIESLSYSSTKSKLDLDHLYTLVGAASDDAEHLGTFTGSTISDSQTIKQSLQALETAVESASGASSLNGLSDVTFSSNDLTIPGLDKIIFDGAVDYDLSGDVTFTENGAAFSFLTLDYNQEKIKLLGNSGNTYLMATIFGTQASIACDDTIEIKANDIHFANSSLGTFGWGLNSGTYSEYISWDVVSNTYQWSNSLDTDDYYKMTVGTHGATTLATVCDSGDNAANLTLDIDGDIELNADGGNITFKDNTADLAEISANGILSKTVVYFDAETANTIGNGATGAIDWTVNQKQKVTITGTSITCNFTNPPGPCNLTLKVVQGDGSDVIANWDGDIKWPSGTAPTLSTGNGAIDILSFYWDGTNYFGVASLNFS